VSEHQEADPNAWMVTFADLVMLLLTFFVLLLSMSSMDTKKLENLMTHFREATGVLEFSGSQEVGNLGSFISKYNDTSSLLVIDQANFFDELDLPESLKKMADDLDEKLTITDDARGVVVFLHENILFDPGKITLNKALFPVLDAIADAILGCENDILIMGHADSRPIADIRYNSNWDLSAQRGLSVLNYFLKHTQLSPERFSVGGYGATRPLYPNDTPEHRALNRRVEIIFKPL
jgi:chemotaxis protein MotB